jgi:hypothetical protein
MLPTDGDPCQELTPLERPRFFAGQILTEQDLRDAQEYLRGKDKRHSRYLHGFGVVCGLRVVPASPPHRQRVVVEPGLALDPWGREIVFPEAVEFALPGSEGGRSESFFLVLEYREMPTHPVPVPGPEEEQVASRMRETYALGLRREPPEGEGHTSREFCKRLQEAIREGMGAGRLHALLGEWVSQPCRPCMPDPAVTLARIDLPARGAITAAEINNWSHRPLALSADRVLQILVCALVGLER